MRFVGPVIKRFVRLLVGDYSVYRIYRCMPAQIEDSSGVPDGMRIESVDQEQLRACGEREICDEAWYAGPGSTCYACFEDARIVGVCFFWYGDRYRKRGFLTLSDDEAKLVHISTASGFRGRGIAPALLRAAAADMFARGFAKLFARVWFTNRPSMRAFEKAGWVAVGLILEMNPLRRRRPLRIERFRHD